MNRYVAALMFSAFAVLFITPVVLHGQQLSIESAIEILQNNSNPIKQAGKGVEIAKAGKQKLNAAWYPFITATGAYVHFSNKIEAKESIKELAEPVTEIIPDLSEIIGPIGNYTFSFPLFDQNVSTIDAAIVWPVFTGGKRIYANRIGKSAIESASLLEQITTESQIVQLIECYYAAKLSREIVTVMQENLQAMEKLYNNANRLLENGVITKAEMLVAKVAWQQAQNELSGAKNNDSIALNSLFTILNIEQPQDTGILFVSPFFMCSSLPNKEAFKPIIATANPGIRLIEQRKSIAANEKKIAQSSYLPTIAAFGKQNLYSYNIPSNLSPSNVIGATFTWNIFDGFNREKSTEIAQQEYENLEIEKNQAIDNLYLLTDKLYMQLSDAQMNLKTITVSIELAAELVKIREKSFKEGMATSTDVVNANVELAKMRTAAATAYFRYDTALSALLALCNESKRFTNYINRNDNIIYKSLTSY